MSFIREVHSSHVPVKDVDRDQTLNGTKDEQYTRVISRISLNTDKAGMEGVDKEKIDRIIYETSKGSKFFQNEMRKQQILDQKIQCMLKDWQSLQRRSDLSSVERSVDLYLASLENGRDLSHTIVHVDMDAFYASVEMRDRPELTNVPMAVGGMSMLSTANYAARRFGVRAAMPGYIALKLCPELIILPHNFEKYRAVSDEIRSIFSKYDPHFCPMSLDEAYLDISQYLLDNPSFSAETVVETMRREITEATLLTSSAGIAANTMLAKICSEFNKPNGQYSLSLDRQKIMEFMRTLPIRKVSGIGKVTEKMLNALGVSTCQDLYEKRALLSLLFHDTAHFSFFMSVALGIGSLHFDSNTPRKSIGVERTFRNLSSWEALSEKCKELSQSLSEDLVKECLEIKSLTLKFKTVKFEVRTRTHSFPTHVCNFSDIFPAALALLRAEMPVELRLMGLRGSNFRGLRILDDSDEETHVKSKSIMDFLRIHESAKQTSRANDDVTSGLTEISFKASDPEIDSNIEGRKFELENESHSNNSISLESATAPLPKTSKEIKCPICSKVLPILSDIMSAEQENLIMNEHVDLCLNRQTVKEMQLSQEKREKETKRKLNEKNNFSSKKKPNRPLDILFNQLKP